MNTYILIKTGSDEILQKNVDSAHLHKEILHAKFGKNRNVGFCSSARTDIHTYIHTDGRTRYSVHAIRASPYRSCTKNKISIR